MAKSILAAGALTLGAAVSALAFGATGAAAQQPTTLTMAVGSPVTSLDPHFHQLSPNNAVADMIFSKLVETDAQARNVPGLATEWRAVGPTTWEFKLRPNVRFHNGAPFTAEDVAATMRRHSATLPAWPPCSATTSRCARSLKAGSASKRTLAAL